MPGSKLSIPIHLLGSLIFLFISFLASPDWPHIGRTLSNPMGIRDLIFQVEILAFFFLNYYLLIDRYYFTRRYLVYTCIVIACFILFVPFTDALIQQIYRQPPPDIAVHGPGPGHFHGFPGFFLSSKVYLFLLVLAFSLLLKIWINFETVKKEKTSAELSFLKSQVNPHFLFNTLNSIYSLAIQQSRDTPDAILRLSSMMRYVLKDTEENFVPLEKEIVYINDYIALQKLRLDKQVTLIFVREGDFQGYKIAPLLLIPFIENVFKYGVNAEQESRILIRLEASEGRLTMELINTKVNTSAAAEMATGLGLINARRRLSLLYPDTHTLLIREDAADFTVNLSLTLE